MYIDFILKAATENIDKDAFILNGITYKYRDFLTEYEN